MVTLTPMPGNGISAQLDLSAMFAQIVEREMHAFSEKQRAERHAWYQQHGNPNALPTANTLRQQRPAAPAKAFGPFAAFDAACEGRTMFVHGYTRRSGVVVSSYYRRPAVRKTPATLFN